MKIVLDAIEEKVRSLLLRFSKEFAKNSSTEVTLRFSGGWVRDKLLGRQSHDIDVAIDKATGEEFAAGLHKFMVDEGIDETSVHKIALNPEKSKHLETATTRVCGLDVDFVNLRSEEYANPNSRVPSLVRFGSPREDAFRRDATLNALFYNLTTGLVEDFTERGLEDLRTGTLRTPLDPAETFNDDPLRVLRLIRFVGQLGFKIAPDTLEAMKGENVGTKLITKVSSERMGAELMKLVESEHAKEGLEYLLNLDLGPYIFKVPDTDVYCSTQQLIRRFDSVVASQSSAPSIFPSDASEVGVLYFSSLLQDLHDNVKAHQFVSKIIQNGLKLTRQTKDGCLQLVNSGSPFDELKRSLLNGDLTRTQMGNYVRKFKQHWKLSLAYNAARLEAQGEPVHTAEAIKAAIVENKLSNAHELKPLLAGKELIALTRRKPGSWLQIALQREIEYQLEHPNAGINDVQRYLLEHLS